MSQVVTGTRDVGADHWSDPPAGARGRRIARVPPEPARSGAPPRDHAARSGQRGSPTRLNTAVGPSPGPGPASAITTSSSGAPIAGPTRRCAPLVLETNCDAIVVRRHVGSAPAPRGSRSVAGSGRGALAGHRAGGCGSRPHVDNRAEVASAVDHPGLARSSSARLHRWFLRPATSVNARLVSSTVSSAHRPAPLEHHIVEGAANDPTRAPHAPPSWRRRRSAHGRRLPTDHMAIGPSSPPALRVAIPGQVSIVGFDDIPLALRRAAAATVHNPITEMAELAFDLAIDNPLARAHHVLAPACRCGRRPGRSRAEPRNNFYKCKSGLLRR